MNVLLKIIFSKPFGVQLKIRKFLYLLLLCLPLSVFQANGQNPIWIKDVGGQNFEQAFSIALDGAGNVYTVGHFYGTSDFDPGGGIYNLTPNGGSDAFISKLDALGNFIWAIQIGGTGFDIFYSLAIDATGNIFVSGTFQNSVDFDPGSGVSNVTGPGSENACIMKISSSGDLIWVKTFSGTGAQRPFSIALDIAGNVYTTGYFTGSVDFDPGLGIFNLISNGGQDIFITKMDVQGDFIWAKGVGGQFADEGFAIAIDGSQNVYASGRFRGQGDFDPGSGSALLTSSGIDDAFIIKLNVSGSLVWCKQVGGSGIDRFYCLALDINSNVFLVGELEGTIDVDPDIGISIFQSVNTFSMYIIKLNSSGTFQWAKQFDGELTGHSIKLDQNNNIFIAGGFDKMVDFDPGPLAYSFSTINDDIFVCKLDPSGNFTYAFQLGGRALDWCRSLAIDGSGFVYITGYFHDTADFDPCIGIHNLVTAGGGDVYIGKFGTPLIGPPLIPIVDVISSANNICAGAMVQFTANITNAFNPSYQWRINGINVGNNSPNYSSSNISNRDIISCTVTNANNPCNTITGSAYDSIIITHASPSIDLNVSQNDVCPGTRVIFTATTFNQSSSSVFKWKLNGKDVGDNLNTYQLDSFKNGDKIYCLLIGSTSSCLNINTVTSDTITMIVKPAPVISIQPELSVIDIGNSIRLNTSVIGPYTTFTWQPTSGLSNPLILSPIASPQTTTTYRLKVSDANNCSSEKEASIIVYKIVGLPNSFTPNNDRINDVFRIPPGNNFALKNFSVYNRFGNLVFNTTDINKGWDGKYKGKDCPVGVYVYLIKGSDTKGEIFVKSIVTLLR